ncbi:MAG: hypothetical protein R3B12_00110 [Candidatus Saccharimonadales bacterium]
MKMFLTSLFATALLFLTISPLAMAASATEDLTEVCKNNPSSSLCKGYDKGSDADPGDNAILVLIKRIINILSFVAGALAVFMVIFGGFKYITSAGEPQKAATGRQTILYSLVGLVVVVLANRLILFAIAKLLN